MHPPTYKLQFDKESIALAVARMGEEITAWARDTEKVTGREVVAIPVLRGGIFFFADLARQIKNSLEIVPGRTSSYRVGENASELDKVKVSMEHESLEGRAVLLVDDICDSGRTLKVLSEYLTEKGVRDVRSAVLIRRVLDKPLYNPHWFGFEYHGNEWFVGYGMEDKNRWSNLPDIYTL